MVREIQERVATERPASDFLARMTYVELKLRLPELLLMRVDKITMATSVEARVPFLDHHLVEYALSLSRALKVEGRSGKHVLKRALEGVLPRDLLYRPKRGFGAPIRGWLRGGAGSRLIDEHLLSDSPLRRRGFFDYSIGRAPRRRAPPREPRLELPPVGAAEFQSVVRTVDSIKD